MYKATFLALPAALLLGISAWAATPDVNVTFSVSGTLGPVLAGSDPAGANGGQGTIMISAREGLKPVSHTARSATFRLPAGAVTAVVSGNNFKSTNAWTLKISFPGTGNDTLKLSGNVKVSGITAHIVGVASLAHGSFHKNLLKHLTGFSPASQSLVPPATYPGPGSTISYSFIGNNTVLGMSGTATSATAASVAP